MSFNRSTRNLFLKENQFLNFIPLIINLATPRQNRGQLYFRKRSRVSGRRSSGEIYEDGIRILRVRGKAHIVSKNK